MNSSRSKPVAKSFGRARPILLSLAISGLTSCTSGPPTWEEAKSSGLAAFYGDTGDVRVDTNGNIAFPGEFVFVDRYTTRYENGWLIGVSPMKAAEQFARAPLTPGKRFYGDTGGNSGGALRRVPDVFDFTADNWNVVLKKDDPDIDGRLRSLPSWLAMLTPYPRQGTAVVVRYDRMLLSRSLEMRTLGAGAQRGTPENFVPLELALTQSDPPPRLSSSATPAPVSRPVKKPSRLARAGEVIAEGAGFVAVLFLEAWINGLTDDGGNTRGEHRARRKDHGNHDRGVRHEAPPPPVKTPPPPPAGTPAGPPPEKPENKPGTVPPDSGTPVPASSGPVSSP